MAPVHTVVLAAAREIADARWRFRLRDVVRNLPEQNPMTVRTHVASRCCVNAPGNHQSRYTYFRALGNGVYVIEPPFRSTPEPRPRARPWQDRLIAALGSGVDPTLLDETQRLTPTERLERMRTAAASLDRIRA